MLFEVSKTGKRREAKTELKPNTPLPLCSSPICHTLSLILSAVTEDAARTIELKNGLSVGSQKNAVKHAMRRAPLQQRRSKADQVVCSDEIAKSKNEKDGSASGAEKPSSNMDETEEHVEARKATALSNALSV